MKPIDYVKHIAEVMPEDALIVASHTDNTSALMSLNITKKSFLGWNMGFATPVGLGLALALPHRKVIILEGDGGVLLLSAAVSDLAAQRPANVIVVVNDNESTLGFPTYTAGGADLAAMAQAAGIKRARTVRDHEEFKAEFDEALAMNELTYIVAKTTRAGSRCRKQ